MRQINDNSTLTELGEALISTPLPELMVSAQIKRARAFGDVQSWSAKVFIPLTQHCRDLCHYCTFSRASSSKVYMTADDILRVAYAGVKAGCTEALLTLGDKPELRYAAARAELAALGHETTVDYLIWACGLILRETNLLPHINAGVMSPEDMIRLREVSVSQGLMLETIADRLSAPGGPHYRSPDKVPLKRLTMINAAGQLRIPFTTGILIGIGETRIERIGALAAIRDAHLRFGHIQEVIVQNFRAKPRTPMADAPEPAHDDHLWSIAAARHILPDAVSIQAPPNLADGNFAGLLGAGINDWGGISPVTLDHVNPERAWPSVSRLQSVTEAVGLRLVARLPAYPGWLSEEWQAAPLQPKILAQSDASGFARADTWSPGQPLSVSPVPTPSLSTADPLIDRLVNKAYAADSLTQDEIERLFLARGPDVEHIAAAADALRQEVIGDAVTFVVNRNINYTNICIYSCGFCAFSKGRGQGSLRGTPYDLDLEEVARRAREAVARGATEVCMQGGIHPGYTGATYLSLLRTVKAAEPDLHVHAFSPLEVRHGAASLGLGVTDFLAQLKEAGLGSLPGTAAEILDDEVRNIICPDKLNSAEWLDTMAAAHGIGLRSTATIMFGHVDTPRHWSRHLVRIRDLQARTGGFTEFVPLPFVPMEAPLALRGKTRRGPTFREVRLMHAVSRLALHPHLTSIQTSWVKLGPVGAAACLESGANDLGGTLMDESISRAAGASHGQEFAPSEMEALIAGMGRKPCQRSTLYGGIDRETERKGRVALPLLPVILTAPRKLPTAQPI